MTTEDYNLAESSWGLNARKLIREVCHEIHADHELAVNIVLGLVMSFVGKSKVGFSEFHVNNHIDGEGEKTDITLTPCQTILNWTESVQTIVINVLPPGITLFGEEIFF